VRRLLLTVLLMLGLAAFLTTTATAAVRIRVGIRPDSIPQCGTGHWSSVLWNTGADSIRVRVSISLVYQDTLHLGPVSGIARLGPRDLRAREFDFLVPPALPEGHYVVVVRAAASDSTYDESVADLTVLPHDCPAPATRISPSAALLQSLLESLALEPDRTTPAIQDSWGALKRRYYTSPKKK
jgi:hypothetical protein